jgi:hypothetical protein
VIAGGQIAADDPRTPDVQALLDRHLEFARAQTPLEHSFALDLDGLLDPAITLFTFREHGGLPGRTPVSRRPSGCGWPARYGVSGCIPAEVNSTGSPGWDSSELLPIS